MTKPVKKGITPQYLYKKDKPVHVYLTIEDYKALMQKLEELSQTAQGLLKKK